MTRYFADTSFWLALAYKRDQHHERAIEWNRFVSRSNASIVTTEAVLWEWLNGLSEAGTRGLAAGGYRRVHQDPRIEVVPFQPTLINSAVGLYAARPDKTWSLTDCLSFLVMQAGPITEALTTDRHFEQAGFTAAMLDEPPK